MASADELRKNFTVAGGALRTTLQSADRNWERKPNNDAEGEEAWSAREAAEHVVSSVVYFASTACQSSGYPKLESPFPSRELSFPTAATAIEALDKAVAVATPAIGQITEQDLTASHERMGTVENVLTILVTHLRDHTTQIQSANQ